MSNDDLIEFVSKCKGLNRPLAPDYFVGTLNITALAELIEAPLSARIAEVEAQLARYEAVAYINHNETGQISIKDINDNAFDISKRVGTKLFALKDVT